MTCVEPEGVDVEDVVVVARDVEVAHDHPRLAGDRSSSVPRSAASQASLYGTARRRSCDRSARRHWWLAAARTAPRTGPRYAPAAAADRSVRPATRSPRRSTARHPCARPRSPAHRSGYGNVASAHLVSCSATTSGSRDSSHSSSRGSRAPTEFTFQVAIRTRPSSLTVGPTTATPAETIAA